MTLMVGASLQHNKYKIQDILNLSDIGATYKAVHTYLNQPVILHTFNQVAQQRPDIDQLKQQFKQQVRLLVQQPQPSLRILDCFEENHLPFAVLPFDPDQPPTKLSDWFTEAIEPNQTEQVVEAQPIPALSSASTPVSVAAASPSSFSVKRVSKRRIPTALITVSLLGGFVGTGMGLALRIASTPQENGKATLGIFNKEQSFPSDGNWPIREHPIYTPETAIEQPLYRTNSPVDPVDPLQTLPSEVYPTYSSPPIPETTVPPTELTPEAPQKEIPSNNTQSNSGVELPPDVDSLYTDEWLPPIDALPPSDRPTAPVAPLTPNDVSPLPPQSNHSLPSSPSKQYIPEGLSIVNQ